MKYWAFLVAKFAVAASFLWGVWRIMNSLLPEPETFLRYRVSRFPQDLSWTTAILGFWLLSIGVVWVVVWDQRRRCRTCLRRLRMPVDHGSWGRAVLLSPPTTESICPFGHGTLEQPQVHTTATQPPEWRTHGDMWRELEELESSGRKQ